MKLDHVIPQYDDSDFRRRRLGQWRSKYRYTKFAGIPLNADPSILDTVIDLAWDGVIARAIFKVRSNIEQVIANTGWRFSNSIPSLTTRDFANYLIRKDMPKLTEYFIPTLGFALDGGRPKHIDDYRQVFANHEVPAIADRYMSDESFANGFVAGANPLLLRRLDELQTDFPINQSHLAQLADFANDDLNQAIGEGRIYLADFKALAKLRDGRHYNCPKYIYKPICAFAVPKSGGLMQPFAIQLGQESEGRDIYTPADGWSWQIAKGMVMVAYGNHHEAVAHLAETHLILEPIVIATYRQLSHRHPLYALFFHHGEGTLQINNLAFAWLLQPNKPFDIMTGSQLDDIKELAAAARLNFDFRANYLPQRLKSRGLDDTKALPYYPYRDDALLVWHTINAWVQEFISCFYTSDDNVKGDTELQQWAAEIASDHGGAIKNFILNNTGITSKAELIDLVTMIIFTAGPQHAAVNFPQKTDMAYMPAAPLAGFIPEITGNSHTEEDYLNFLPPIEVACTSQMALEFLGDIYFNKLGNYALTFDLDSDAVKAAISNFERNLKEVEAIISERDKSRVFTYPHLRPSRIPKSINI